MHYTESQALNDTVAVANNICNCSISKLLVDCGHVNGLMLHGLKWRAINRRIAPNSATQLSVQMKVKHGLNPSLLINMTVTMN